VPDRLGRRDTLGSALYRNGLRPQQVHEVAQALRPHFDPRQLREGDEVEIQFDVAGDPRAVIVHHGPLETYVTRFEGSRWSGARMAVPLDSREVARQGVLAGSLFDSLGRTGEQAAVAIAFAQLFASDFDFYTESREGDRFSLVVEKVYRDGRFVSYGRLLAARYQSANGRSDLAGFFYQSGSVQGHYDRDGRSLRKAFLKAPLDYQRISSRFSHSRRHPILGRAMPHLGVDYAAPAGTPVHSVAKGVVTALTRGGGGGNTVTIRHAQGYTSKYMHLARFARGLRVGRAVDQKEIIGYVGSTGLATGPHLDFRLTRHGRPINPLREIFPPGEPIPDDRRADYLRHVERLAARLSLTDAGAGERAAEP
jgi:murein DD-endopeptidase MepM/ murein hydrolase activator NlpD